MTPEDEETLREGREALERRAETPRDEEEAASFKGMGHAVTIIRERRGMTREELAPMCKMALPELEGIESGELHARWGELRRIAIGLGIPLPELLNQAEEHAPGPGGEEWRRKSAEAGSGSTVPGARSDAAEGGKQS
jgi:transcriptional regulator with XRE-family HTH domain